VVVETPVLGQDQRAVTQTLAAGHRPFDVLVAGSPRVAWANQRSAATPACPAASTGGVGELGGGSGPGSLSLVLCFGDSLTSGMGGASYPDFLVDFLRQSRLRGAGGRRLRVLTRGNWGDGSSEALARFPEVLAEVASEGPLECVLILVGTNDLPTAPSSAVVISNLRRLHALAAAAPGAPSPRVGVLTLPPFTKYGYEDRQRGGQLGARRWPKSRRASSRSAWR